MLIEQTVYTKRVVSVRTDDFLSATQEEVDVIRSPKLADIVESYIQSDTVLSVGKLTIPAIELDLEILPELSNSNLLLGCVSLFPKRVPMQNDLVLLGHNMNYSNLLFNRLDELKAGDIIYLEYNQTKGSFEVAQIYIASENEIELLDDSRQGLLRLITCDSVYETPQRLIVDAKKIESDKKLGTVKQSPLLTTNKKKTVHQQLIYHLSSKGALTIFGLLLFGLFILCFFFIHFILGGRMR
ncbi:class A sortase [Enterococcus sp. AZ194]|uniref:class A sortase n=1 Tax=Enterococcus sp. AZ194 TaxID=2774629 RepID=UPI003F684ED9